MLKLLAVKARVFGQSLCVEDCSLVLLLLDGEVNLSFIYV
jgi:hypothetical protein